jgi:putative membrane protein
MDRDYKIKIFYFLFYLIFLVGIAGHFSEKYFKSMLEMTPVVLLLSGTATLAVSGKLKSNKFIVWFIASFSITFLLELTGVHTGLIFGSYKYGEVLGFRVSGVPLVIGFNWILIILGAFSISNSFSKNTFLVCFLSGILSVAFDFIMEPVAVKLGYWQWDSGIIPLLNYISWFVISFSAAFSLIYFRINPQSDVFKQFYSVLLLFFLILNFR